MLIDVFFKSTDTHQYLHVTSCHVYHSKDTYRTVRLCVLTGFVPRINFFDVRCNDLALWLKTRAFNEKLVRKQILEARKYRRTNFCIVREKKFINITYCPIFSKLKNILSKIHLLLTRIGNTVKFLRTFR